VKNLLIHPPVSETFDAIADDVRDPERWQFLQHCLKLKPAIETELAEAANDLAKLKSWAQRWHLTSPWCARLLRQGGFRKPVSPKHIDILTAGVLDTSARIEAGEDFPPDEDRIPNPVDGRLTMATYEADGYFPAQFMASEFKPILPSFFYSPEAERPDEFKERVLKDICTLIDDFCARTREEALLNGWTDKPDWRITESSIMRFEWLARRQILGQRSVDIAVSTLPPGRTSWAAKGSVDRDIAQKTIERLAKYLDLKLRRV
jgi:hypothetical protein